MALNDIPLNASDDSITFSGYTGPTYFIDFKKEIIIIILCNVTHKNSLNRIERKKLTEHMIEEIFETLI